MKAKVAQSIVLTMLTKPQTANITIPANGASL